MEIKGMSLTDQMQMMKGLQPIVAPTKPNSGETPTQAPEESQGVSFADYLQAKVEEVNQLGVDADKKIESAMRGEEENPHATMIALQKADISFNLLMSVKDRIIEAYQQVIRTPIG